MGSPEGNGKSEEARRFFRRSKDRIFDENARVIADPDHSDEEERFILLGLSSQLRLLVVCHCYREDQGTIPIISARKANRSEQQVYEGFRHA
jgi:uncharacterized DUF497 family protein